MLKEYFKSNLIVILDDTESASGIEASWLSGVSSDTSVSGVSSGAGVGCHTSDEELVQCECPCCCMSDSPSKPLNVTKSKQVYSHNSQQLNWKKSYSQSIQASWYEKYPWITVCTSCYKVFCHTCRIAKQMGLITSFKSSIFVDDGFSNWKKAIEKFRGHKRSDSHKEAVVKVAALFSGTDIGAQLNAEHKKSQVYHQRMLLKLLSTICFLARQGLPLWGHFEDLDHLAGNLYRLLLLRAEDCSELKLWIYKSIHHQVLSMKL